MTGSEPFRYRAATGTGEIVEGVVHAGSARDAADALRQQTLVPVNIESATRQAPRKVSARGNRRDSVAASIRTVATLLSAGVSLERALEFAGRHASHPEITEAFRAVRSDVQRGVMMSDAVRKQAVLGAFAAM